MTASDALEIGCAHGVSIITIYANNQTALYYFLRSVEASTHSGPTEILIVDDASELDCAPMVEAFRTSWAESSRNASIRLIRQENNLGNCVSRNVGIAASSYDHLFIVDCDSPISSEVLEAHHEALCDYDFDVVIGSRGIETNGRHPIDFIRHLEATDYLWIEESKWQDSSSLTSYLNFVTRNVSVSRAALDRLGGEPFDPAFSYSRDPNSGFGWEDVDLGCRLYESGARFVFEPRGFTVHITHQTKVGEAGKGLRSARNLRALLDKHSWLPEANPHWAARTLEAVDLWVKREPVVSQATGVEMEGLLRRVTPASAVVPRSLSRRLRILSHRWHVPHQHELHRLDADFTLVRGIDGFTSNWGWGERTPQANVRWIDHNQVNPEDYDLVLGHFDENVLPGVHKPTLLSDDWGAAFWWLIGLGLPTVVVCHGTPPTYLDEAEGQRVVDDFRAKLRDVLVVTNSYQARLEWAFESSHTIWHGMSPADFRPPRTGLLASAWSLPDIAFERRPEYNGAEVHALVAQAVPWLEPFRRTPFSKTHSINHLSSRANYLSYLRQLGSRNIYFNPTKFSPMPRMRTEAMWLGAVSVSARNHDVDMFIDSGRNGFLFTEAEEAIDQMNFLWSNPEELTRMSIESRATAARAFNVDRFLAEWRTILTRYA